LYSWDEFTFDTGTFVHGIGQVVLGYGDAAVGTVHGAAHAVANPRQTARGVANAIAHPVDVGKGVAKATADCWNSGIRGQWQVIGDALIAVGTALAPAAQAGNAAKIEQVAAAAALNSEVKAAVATAPLQSAKQTILQNAKQGAAAEKLVAQQLADEGRNVIGRRVSVNTAEGRRVLDNLVDDGDTLVNVEVKSGRATRDASQIAKDKAMSTAGGTPVGKNAPDQVRGRNVKIETEVRRVSKEEISD
jgi:hypothetical protein